MIRTARAVGKAASRANPFRVEVAAACERNAVYRDAQAKKRAKPRARKRAAAKRKRSFAVAHKQQRWTDLNAQAISHRGVGVTAGLILNSEGWAPYDHITDSHFYAGIAIGRPGVGASDMTGIGRTEGGGRRYIEIGGGAGPAAGAWGFRSDAGAGSMNPMDSDYAQWGFTTPGLSLQWFNVF